MSLRVNTNLASQSAIGTLKRINNRYDSVSSKLSSNNRIFRSAEDPSGLAISTKLNANAISSQQAIRNANDGISIFQVAESTLGEVQKIGLRMRELSMQAANDTMTDKERRLIQVEMNALKDQVTLMAESTTFNGIQLLNGISDNYQIQVGLDNNPFEDRLNFRSGKIDATLRGLGIDTVNLASKQAAQNSLGAIDGMVHKLSSGRTEIGAVMSRMESTMSNLGTFKLNTKASKSRIADADVAVETAENAKINLRRHATSQTLKMANMSTERVLKLLE